MRVLVAYGTISALLSFLIIMAPIGLRGFSGRDHVESGVQHNLSTDDKLTNPGSTGTAGRAGTVQTDSGAYQVLPGNGGMSEGEDDQELPKQFYLDIEGRINEKKAEVAYYAQGGDVSAKEVARINAEIETLRGAVRER